MTTPPTSNDKQQMQRIAKLWVKAQPSVSVFIRASVRDHHAAEDVLQEVAGAVIASFDRYDPERPFGAWVMGVARNCILRYYRSVSRDRVVFDDALLDLMCDSYVRISDDAGLYDAALRQCVDKLGGKSRRVVELRYHEDLSSDQIADRLKMTPVAVRVMLHRVRKGLRTCIDNTVEQMRTRPGAGRQGGVR